MIEQLSVDTITNAGMGASFILYLIYDRTVVLKKLMDGFKDFKTEIREEIRGLKK